LEGGFVCQVVLDKHHFSVYYYVYMNTLLPHIPIIKSVTDLRYKAREIMEHVQGEGKTVLLTRDSDPVAVLFPVKLYEAIRQYIEQLEDARDIRSMKTVLARREKTSDFASFDKATRKKHGFPAYVSHRTPK